MSLDFFFGRKENVTDTDERPSSPGPSRSTEDELKTSSSEAVVEEESSTTLSECSCACCTFDGPPSQPNDVEGSKQTYEHASKTLKRNRTYYRLIQPTWYKRYPWITVCTSSYKIFCHTCRFSWNKGLVTFSKRRVNNFVTNGFCNWKKALEKMDEHEKSDLHKESVLKHSAYISETDVGVQLSAQLSRDQKSHQSMLLKVISTIRFLARQGLALRGHLEDVNNLEGNFYQLLLLQAEELPELKSWILKKEYTSPEILNEIITIMGQSVLRKLLTRIQSCLWFSIIVDEATDISRNEQMSLSIPWVENDYSINEECIGLVQLPDTRAKTIFSLIKDILIRCSLPLSQCRGQAFDGAANMSGSRNGVQALVKQEESQVLYVHCLAHNLNLCIQRTVSQCEIIRNVMDFAYELLQLINFSPKRLTLFNSIRSQAAFNGSIATPSLRSLCPTRWTVRHSSLNSILLNYTAIIETLDEVKNGRDEYAARANGLLMRMETYEILFGLKLAHLLFSSSEQFATSLQAKDTSIHNASCGAELLVTHYNSLRHESQFNHFYESVLPLSSGLTDEPTLPRYRKRPKRLESGDNPHCYKEPKDRYRHLYFEVLELASGEIERRFNQSDMNVMRELESVLVKAANGEKPVPGEELMIYLKKDIDNEWFMIQISMIRDMIKTACLDVQEVTSLRTISDAMNQTDIYKQMLGEIHKALKLYYTCPVTTSTAERSFSSLRRLKTFLRSSMTQSRLNNLLLLYIHLPEVDSLDLRAIAQEFVSVNARRLHYFGKM